ncbi:MAG: hypothetical protein ACOX74_08485 [Lachnospiraceae bacterium]
MKEKEIRLVMNENCREMIGAEYAVRRHLRLADVKAKALSRLVPVSSAAQGTQ